MRYMTTDSLTSGMRVSFPRRFTSLTVDHVWVNINDEPVIHFTNGYTMVTSWDEQHIVLS